DRTNPYAPPRAELGSRPLPSNLSAIPVTVGDVFSRTWQIYRDQLGLCIGGFFVVGLVSVAFQMVMIFLQVAMQQAGSSNSQLIYVQSIGSLGGYILQAYLMAGQTLFMLKIARGQNAQISDIFAGGRYLLTMSLAMILLYLAVLGIMAVSALPAILIINAVAGDQGVALPIVIGVCILLGVAGLVAFSVRYSQFPYLIIDRNAGAVESFGLSNRLMRGHEGQLILLWLLFIAINILGFLAFCIGLIFSIPLTFLLMAVFYVALTGQSGIELLGPDDFRSEEKPHTDPDFGSPDPNDR
ncbi:MAG: DUF975 family protein, partial [Singulisphaera sp.]|nr:DUF975 family protein [Singulisphaera sp.]